MREKFVRVSEPLAPQAASEEAVKKRRPAIASKLPRIRIAEVSGDLSTEHTERTIALFANLILTYNFIALKITNPGKQTT